MNEYDIAIGREEGKKEQFLKDLKLFGYRLAIIHLRIDRYIGGAYKEFSKEIYVIPNNIGAGHIGKFPYGNRIVTGLVTDKEIDIQELKEKPWFPDTVKMMIIE